MANNNNSPVLDGIWFRPYLLEADTTNRGANLDPNATKGNSIPATAKVAEVKSVKTNTSDWITLPSLADVPNGHEITILCNAASNFLMRTPTSSNEKINNVDADDSAAYLCTDTDIIRAFKINNTVGWIIQSLTNLGAVRTAVVPS